MIQLVQLRRKGWILTSRYPDPKTPSPSEPHRRNPLIDGALKSCSLHPPPLLPTFETCNLDPARENPARLHLAAWPQSEITDKTSSSHLHFELRSHYLDFGLVSTDGISLGSSLR